MTTEDSIPWKQRLAFAKRLPPKLVDIGLRANDAASGFWVLGEYEALREFGRAVINRLHGKNWPVSVRDKDGCSKLENDPNHAPAINGVDQAMNAIVHHRQRRVDFCCSVALHLTEKDREAAQAFLFDESNLGVLEETINEVIGRMKTKYGDPLAVLHDQKSMRRAFVQATRNGLEKIGENEETKLIAAMIFLSFKMDEYERRHGVSSFKFFDYVTGYLETWKKWPLKNPGGELSTQFCSLVSAAQWRPAASIHVRWQLQDETIPPRKSIRNAKDFILSRSEDIREAVLHAANRLNIEHSISANPGPQP